MNDAAIIVTVVLLVGIVAAVVFVVWRTRYQPVKNPFRSHNDAPVEQVVIRDADFRPSTSDARRASAEAKNTSATGNEPGNLLLHGLAIGHIASALHPTDDSTRPSPSADSEHRAAGESAGRANETSSESFSSAPDSSSDGGGESSGGGSSDSGSGSE